MAAPLRTQRRAGGRPPSAGNSADDGAVRICAGSCMSVAAAKIEIALQASLVLTLGVLAFLKPSDVI